jgi:hypothetical protein
MLPNPSQRFEKVLTLQGLVGAAGIEPATPGFCFRDLAGSHSKYPLGLFSSAVRNPSVSGGSPPATIICIISEVPERGSPETTVINVDP